MSIIINTSFMQIVLLDRKWVNVRLQRQPIPVDGPIILDVTHTDHQWMWQCGRVCQRPGLRLLPPRHWPPHGRTEYCTCNTYKCVNVCYTTHKTLVSWHIRGWNLTLGCLP